MHCLKGVHPEPVAYFTQSRWERITHREMRSRIERQMGLDTAIRALPRIDRDPTFCIGDGMFYRLVATANAQAVAA
ncbi:hypothetical protein MMAGJ_73270 [Mycolicibacterium mageritense]|uniref:Uncharacterized protein n=1 Tax=Mycolicibacterium mageritense TaxID=53462 RepID=A0ABN5YJB0_MYCME|nr:hypothetical protein MMAGJ_73270 [Mycolicibacterium mageritense]CDO27219.1 hypothetical protein BN978_07785 [Mycolicibacterium mageritense DSM 44476 = CIP 104973]